MPHEYIEWDYALRAPLAAVYRALREAGGAEGEACEAMLSGDGAQPRSAALAGRLVRVLAELGLVILEREAPALTVAESPERTALERSAAFRAYQQTTRGRTDDSWRAAHRERQPDPARTPNGAARCTASA